MTDNLQEWWIAFTKKQRAQDWMSKEEREQAISFEIEVAREASEPVFIPVLRDKYICVSFLRDNFDITQEDMKQFNLFELDGELYLKNSPDEDL